MSLLIFPLTFNSAVGFPIKQTPIFNTITQTAASGRGELRIPTMNFPRWDFVIDISYLRGDAQGTNSAWQQLINFYIGVLGAASDWLFLHPYDSWIGNYTVTGSVTSGTFIPYETIIQAGGGTAAILGPVLGSNSMTISAWQGTASGSSVWVGQTSGAHYTPTALPALSYAQAIAIGDGVTTAFSMLRTFVVGGAQDMMQNFVFNPNIYVNGALKTLTTDYSIDIYGTITFTTAPANTAVIAWTGQFYYRCHFLEDSWSSMEEDLYTYWTVEGLKFRSVLL